MVRQAQKEGQAKASSPEVARVASRIKKSDAKDFASTKHKGLPEKKKMNEEGYDHYRDNILMKGGDHRSKETKNRSYTPSKPIKGKTAAQKAAKGKSALEIVKKSITDKYGKGAIMNLKKEGTAYGIYRGDGKMKFGQKKKEDKKKEEVKAVPADTMEGMYDIDPKTGKSPVASSVEKGNKKKGDKRLRHFAKLAKKMVGEAYGGKGVSRKAKLASTHPPTAKAAIKNIPTETDRGSGNKANKRAGVIPKPTNPSNVIPEAKVDKGRSDYGKASIRNYRRSGPGHDDPGMFDPSGKRGKTIEKRREEHKARRGVKGAKVPAYKVEEKDTSAMKKFLDDKAKKLEKKRNAQSDAAKNNPAFDSTSPRSRSYAGLQLSGDNRLGKILEALTAKERMKRDAGAIAKKKMRNKEHKKYVNFLDVDENTIHSFNTFIQNNKPYDSQKEVSEESDKESKVETSLLRFSECWKTHKKVGMKMKGGKLVNDCRPKNEAKEYTGPDKEDRKVIKKMDNPSYAKKLADYEKNMDPKKRQALRDKATKGMKFTHEETLSELKMPKDTKYHKMSYKNLKKTHKDFKNMDSTPPRVTTLDKKTNATVSRPVKFVPDKKKTNEAANPAQQAAIAIDMKKKGKKPKDVQEATRLKKEMGYDKGGTKKPTAPKQKDTALDLVKKSITAKYGKGAIMSGGSRQQKKVKGEKDTRGTGKFKKAADAKKQTASDAKKRGFKDVKSYVNTMARYGGKDNYDKGKGLGT